MKIEYKGLNISSIKEGSHGSGSLQKRLWKLVSDYVRIRDFYEYGQCVSCNKRFLTWKDTDWQAGHYYPYSVCKGYTKFYVDNIFGQCSRCNRGFNGSPSGATFKENIIKRYGQEQLDLISIYPQSPVEKLNDVVILDLIYDMVQMIKELPEKPDYFEKIIKDHNN
jgi:hypothetical protein